MDEHKTSVIQQIITLNQDADALILATYSVVELESYRGRLRREQSAAKAIEGEPE